VTLARRLTDECTGDGQSLEALFAQTRQSEAEAEGYLVDGDWEAEAIPTPGPLQDGHFPDGEAADLWQRVFAGEMVTASSVTETTSAGTNGRVVTFEELASVVRRPKPRHKPVPEGQLALFDG